MPCQDPIASAPPGREDRRLLWHCRRGMKELDMLLEGFARRALPGARPDERARFAQLLALPDPTLAGYLLGGQTHPEPELAHLLERIRTLCRSET